MKKQNHIYLTISIGIIFLGLALYTYIILKPISGTGKGVLIPDTNYYYYYDVGFRGQAWLCEYTDNYTINDNKLIVNGYWTPGFAPDRKYYFHKEIKEIPIGIVSNIYDIRNKVYVFEQKPWYK